MEHLSISNNAHVLKPAVNNNQKVTPAKAQEQFANSLKDAINNLNETQANSDKATKQFINGQITDLHDVMIASQKSSVTRSLAVEVRNKVIESYKEVMRMQV